MSPQGLPKPKLAGSALEGQLAMRRARRPADPLLSLVVPVFDEQESIGLFIDTVVPLLEREGLRFEMVFVNDGSRDKTLAHLLARSAGDRRIRPWRVAAHPDHGAGAAHQPFRPVRP